MKNQMLFCAVVSVALASGCNREGATSAGTNETAHVNVSSMPAYQVKYEEMAAKLKIGMGKDDLRRALGDPTETKGIYGGGKNYGLWLYRVEQNIWLRIRFDDDEKVATWNMASENVIQ